VGLWDDVRGLRAGRKLAALTLISAGMYVAGYRISGVSNPFGGAVNLGYWAAPLTLFWFLGCMNALNLIDGLDGLASGVAVFAAATIFLTSMLFQNTAAALLSVAMAGAVLGFLLFNFHPASIFLGDSGSYLLGFLIAAIGLRGTQKSNTVVALLIPVIAMGLPAMDTALAILRRWSRALPLSASDRQHIHHRLLDWGLTQRQAVLVLYGACLVLAGFALLMTAARNVQAAALLALLGAGTFAAVRLIGRSDIKLAKQRLIDGLERRRRGAECRAAGHVAAERMRRAGTVPAIWSIFSDAADVLHLDRASMILHMGLAGNGQKLVSFRWEGEGHDWGEDEVTAMWSVTLPLVEQRVRLGELKASAATNGLPLEPELPSMLAFLGSAMAQSISRVEAAVPEAAPSDVQPMRIDG